MTHDSSLITVFCVAQHTSIWRLCSIVKSASDQFVLIFWQPLRELVEREPVGASNLDALTLGYAARPPAKNNLNLARSLQRPHESYLGALKLQAYLFAQLPTKRFFRLLAPFDKAAGDAPA